MNCGDWFGERLGLMDDSTQSSLFSDTNQFPWVIASLTLSIKLLSDWPSGNKYQSFPPSQPCWYLRLRLSSFNLVWAAAVALSGSVTKKLILTYQFVRVSGLKFFYSIFATSSSSTCLAYLREWWWGLVYTTFHSNDIYSATSHFFFFFFRRLSLSSLGC